MMTDRRSRAGRSQVGRLGGCLWLIMAGFSFLFVAAALGVGVDASFLLLPIVVAPFVLAVVVFVGGDRMAVLIGSAVAGLTYAVLGALNAIRAQAFERANPGADEISGGEVSLAFVLLAAGIGVWSAAASLIAWRRRR